MKIAVLYIGIGAYSAMWDGFFESAQKHFFVHDQVDYFVFTDNLSCYPNRPFIHLYSVPNYGWPGNTLFRFHMFLEAESDLTGYDYCFFFNANACFEKDVSKDILPYEDSALVGVEHFKYYDKNPLLGGYDRNPRSTAYVPWGHEGDSFCQACLIGGRTPDFLLMCHSLDQNIQEDQQNGVCAIWHDESHFNKYIIDKKPTILGKKYAVPEFNVQASNDVVILMRDKRNFSTMDQLRFGGRVSHRLKIHNKLCNQVIKIQKFFCLLIFGHMNHYKKRKKYLFKN